VALTLIRPDVEIRKSFLYDDTVAAGGTMESGSVNIEDDLNTLRSQLKRFTGETNWFDTLTGRTVGGLDTDLTDLEDKRILCGVEMLTNVTVPAGVAATGILTLAANANDTETVTIGTKAYTFQTALTDVDGNVLIGATASDSLDNLIAAITLGAGSGSLYAASMTANVDVSAAAGAGDTMDATALVQGTVDNSTATTETMTGGSWGAVTLTGGAGDVVVLVQASSETPSQAAAVNAGTALGAVCATLAGDVGGNDLAEVSSTNPTVPKNRVLIRDAALKEGLTTNGRQIYGLLQAENGVVDGDPFDDTTKQAQLSFVYIDDTIDDLVPCPGDDIAGKVIEYVYARRVNFDALPEDCSFPKFTFTDGSASVSVTLDNAVDNQGIVPVTQSTNIDWDLGAAREFFFRDNAAADLFGVKEGSGGGTSEVQLAAAVDVFNVDAIDNDFANGATFDTAGTGVQIGETAGTIERAADLTVFASGAGELFLHDSNISGEGSWAQAGVKLTESAAEVTAYETAFGGEVSLFNAITQAKNAVGAIQKTFANCTLTTTKDNDIGGTAGGANLDAQLHDISNGDFLVDHDVYINGRLRRPGADASANNDYYPGTSLALGQLKLEFTLRTNDVVAIISRE